MGETDVDVEGERQRLVPHNAYVLAVTIEEEGEDNPEPDLDWRASDVPGGEEFLYAVVMRQDGH